MNVQRRFDLAGEGLGELHGHAFFPDFQQRAAKLLARAVKQLHAIAFVHAQHAADVMRLGFGQFVVAKA